MQYDIFISYCRRDNKKGQVSRLVERIEKEFEAFAERPLKPFFDTNEISGGEYWQDKLLKGLKDSRLMLACLSPEYLKSQWCEWEFNEYQKHELGRAYLGRGMAPIYFVRVPEFEEPGFDAACKAWIADLRKRQHYDLRPWKKYGEKALEQADVAARMKELTAHIWEQIEKGELAEHRKGNLDRGNERFVGRVEEMRRLHRLVGLGRVGVLTAVNGLGGIGKTALALQYAHAYGDTFAGGCWQIRCEGKADLKEAFASLLGERDMVFELTDEEKKSADRQFERILRELKHRADAAGEALKAAGSPAKDGNRARVLVILDNVDKPELLSDEQTKRLPKAEWLCLLATTRLGGKQLPNLGKDDFLPVDELPEADALALLESHQPGKAFADAASRDAALEIVRLLGCMPLAVEVAAVFLGENPDISCADYLACLKEEGLGYYEDTADETEKDLRAQHKRLTATLRPTLERLSDQERLALDYAAIMPPDHVPLPWLRDLVAMQFPEYGQDAKPGRRDPWVELVRRLLSMRLLQETGVAAGNGYPLLTRMHRLVREVIFEYIKPDMQPILKYALETQAYNSAMIMQRSWESNNEVLWQYPTLYAMFASGCNNIKSVNFARLCLAVGLIESRIGTSLKARYIIETAVTVLEGIDPQAENSASIEYELAQASAQLGDILVAQGNIALAHNMHNKSLNIRLKLANNDPGNSRFQRALSISYGKIGDMMLSVDKPSEALTAYKTSLLIREKFAEHETDSFGWQRSLPVIQSKIGDALIAMGNITDAMDAYNKSQGALLRLASYHPGHTTLQRDIAISYDRVGDVSSLYGNIGLALNYYSKSLQIRTILSEQFLNNLEYQRDLAVSHSKVGDMLHLQGDLSGALKAYRDGCAIFARLTEADPSHVGWHQDLSVSQEKIGDLLQAQGDPAGALKAYQDSLGIRAQLAEADPSNAGWHLDMSSCHSNVGDVLSAQGDLSGALTAYQASLGIHARLAEADPGNAVWQRDLSVSHIKVGDVLLAQGDLSGALTAYQASMGIRARLAEADPSHAGWQRDVWVSCWRIASALESSGDGRAQDYWRKAYDKLSEIKRAGLFVSPQDEEYLEDLRAKVGRR